MKPQYVADCVVVDKQLICQMTSDDRSQKFTSTDNVIRIPLNIHMMIMVMISDCTFGIVF